ncbi:hypothetical protein [Amycolatopsis taiwanensis]|uniref:DUF2269 domain-containing protein n=1 Tax=Amycolatopsis taiwanensis TaxID=342230 RepID=A0A9W6R8U2_9PSEU|nr:hypothetical protein [Amycolatopsis taiwanensis]GLY69657.1 hypothetical protein Atai01_62760 [Amycolatopsis taiwanensis]
MTRRRRLLVVLHVLTSVSGVGTLLAVLLVVAYGLSIEDAVGQDPLLRLAGDIQQFLGIPLLSAAVVIGTLSALYSPWGLLRHTWVLKKLALTLVNLGLAVFLIGPRVSQVAGEPLSAWLVVGGLIVQLFLYLLATGLSVFKPKGLLRAGPSSSRIPAESRR